MSETAVVAEAGTVQAGVNYLIDTGVKPVNETGGRRRAHHPPHRAPRPRTVTIHDARPERASFTLDGGGLRAGRPSDPMRDFYDLEELSASTIRRWSG